MVKQAKSVGQLIAALSRAANERNPGAFVTVEYDDAHKAYEVAVQGTNGAAIVSGTGPKLFKLTAEVGAKFLASQAPMVAAAKLQARIGDIATMGAAPEVDDSEDEPSERF